MPEVTNLAIALLLSAIAVIQVFALWILSGVRSSIRDLWQVANNITNTMHEVDKRVAVVESSIERRKQYHQHRRKNESSPKRR